LLRNDSRMPVVGATTSPSDADIAPSLSDTTLQPDITYACEPWVHIIHTLFFAVCTLVSVSTFLSELPLPEKRLREVPWEGIIVPLIIQGFIGSLMHAYYVLRRHRALRMQLGPEPNPDRVHPAAVLQYNVMYRLCLRQYVASHVGDAIVLLGTSFSTLILYAQLVWQGSTTPAWRIVVLPTAIAGIISLVLHTVYRVRCVTNSDFLVGRRFDDGVRPAQSIHQSGK
jgi:hypothetical protein